MSTKLNSFGGNKFKETPEGLFSLKQIDARAAALRSLDKKPSLATRVTADLKKKPNFTLGR